MNPEFYSIAAVDTGESLSWQATELLNSYPALHGLAFAGGSYALNVMACPDLDLYVPRARIVSPFKLAETLYSNPLTEEVYVQKGTSLGLPEGELIQVRTNLQAELAAWKIDIWILPPRLISERMNYLAAISAHLTDQARADIRALKRRLLQANGFTPKYSGLYIYHGYLEEGIREVEPMKEYLRANGVAMA